MIVRGFKVPHHLLFSLYNTIEKKLIRKNQFLILLTIFLKEMGFLSPILSASCDRQKPFTKLTWTNVRGVNDSPPFYK